MKIEKITCECTHVLKVRDPAIYSCLCGRQYQVDDSGIKELRGPFTANAPFKGDSSGIALICHVNYVHQHLMEQIKKLEERIVLLEVDPTEGFIV